MTKKKTIIPEETWSNPSLSPGIRTGDFLFVSGQIAMDPSGQIVGVNNCEVQTRQVMTNLQAVVEAKIIARRVPVSVHVHARRVCRAVVPVRMPPLTPFSH